MAFDPDGALYITDTYNHRIRRVGTDGIITTIAGNGFFGFSGDGGPATEAALSSPYSMVVGGDGALLRRLGQPAHPPRWDGWNHHHRRWVELTSSATAVWRRWRG
ncbi:MAG: hypothetical protein IPK19_17435 [Chloroflexi bacterium]|nr:hypothetical protein [Chloroflexota bacterium]